MSMSDELEIPAPTYRVPRHRRGMDAGTRRLAFIAGGLGGALLLLVGGWSVLGHRSGGIPVIEADSSPVRVKPDNPGGMQVGGTSEEILSDTAGGQAGKLAPGAETPAPQQLAAPVAPAATSPSPAASSSAASAPPAVAPAVPPSSASATAAKPAAKTAAGPVPVHPAGKGTLVQLAALMSEDAAKSEWQRLEKRMPSLLEGRQPAVSKIERDGKTYWRLRTGGFSDVAQATAFCEQVRAKGSGCSIASF
jgi:hypothetical protein